MPDDLPERSGGGHASSAIWAKIRPRFPDKPTTSLWYETHPLTGFGGRTAQDLVQEGRIREVIDFIDAIDVGGHQ